MPTLIFFIVFITTLVSLYYVKKFKNTIYILFIYLLCYTFLTELLSNINLIYYLKYDKFLFNTSIVKFSYNLYIIISFLFYFFFYKKLFKKKGNKEIMNVFIIGFVLFLIFNLMFLKSTFTNGFNTNNVVVGAIFLLITLILFLMEIINIETIVFNIKKSFIFWISVGLLLFYIGVIPIMISKKYLNYGDIYFFILNGLNVIMYGCFIIGFIKSDSKYNY